MRCWYVGWHPSRPDLNRRRCEIKAWSGQRGMLSSALSWDRRIWQNHLSFSDIVDRWEDGPRRGTYTFTQSQHSRVSRHFFTIYLADFTLPHGVFASRCTGQRLIKAWRKTLVRVTHMHCLVDPLRNEHGLNSCHPPNYREAWRHQSNASFNTVRLHSLSNTI